MLRMGLFFITLSATLSPCAATIVIDFDDDTFSPLINNGSVLCPWSLTQNASNLVLTTDTGPTGDHTTGKGYYAYVESSLPNNPNVGPFILEMSLPGLQTISFWYSMYGATMGILKFDTFSERGSGWTTQWNKTGNQGTEWQETSLTFEDDTISRFRFDATTGSSFASDIAIDDITISTTPTPIPTPLPTITPPPTPLPSFTILPTLSPTIKEYYLLDSGTSCPSGLEMINETECSIAAAALGYTYSGKQFFSGSPRDCFTNVGNVMNYNDDKIGVDCNSNSNCVCKYLSPTHQPTLVPTHSVSPTIAPTPSPTLIPTPAPTITCQNGTYFSSDSNSCNSCEKGKYTQFSHKSPQPTSCTLCPIGQYGNSFGAKACIECATGKLSTSDRTSCEDCAAGQYNNNETECVSCEKGKFAPSAQDDACLDCFAGDHTNNDTGATTCSSCDAGKYSEDYAVDCIDCTKGTYSVSRASSCLDCAIGTYSNVTGATSCTSCAAGTYSASTGSTLCFDCLKGEYQPTTGQSLCLSCESGTYSNKKGSLLCLTCNTGYDSDDGASQCLLAISGYFLDNNISYKCSSHTVCEGGYYLPYPNEGYWVDRSAVSYLRSPYKCPRDTCKGGHINSNGHPNCWLEGTLDNKVNCTDDELLCKTGARGPLCSSCEDHYRYSTSTLQCEECGGASTVLSYILAGLLFITMVGLMILYALKILLLPTMFKNTIENGSLSVIFTTYQIVQSITYSMELVYPSPFTEYLQFFNFLNFELPGLECSNIGVFDRVYITSLVPMGIAVLIVLFGMLRMNKVDHTVSTEASKTIHLIQSQHAWAVLFLSYLVLPPVTGAQFKALDCYTFSDTDQSRYLRMDTSIDCDSDSFHTFLLVNVVLIFIYLSIPIVWFVLLWRSKKALFPYGIINDEALIAKKRKLDKSLSSISFLFERYRSSMIYWECVDIFRRILFIGVVPLMATTTLLRASIGSLFSFLYIIIAREMSPYHSEATNTLSFLACVVIYLTYQGSLAIETGISASLNQAVFGTILMLINLAVVITALGIAYYKVRQEHLLLEKKKNALVQHIEWAYGFSKNKFATTFDTLNATVISSSHCAYNYYGSLAEIKQILRSGILVKDSKHGGIVFTTHQPDDLTRTEKEEFHSLEAFVVCSLPKRLMTKLNQQSKATSDGGDALFVLNKGILQGIRGFYYAELVDALPWEEGKLLLPPRCIKRAYQLVKEPANEENSEHAMNLKNRRIIKHIDFVLPYEVSLIRPDSVSDYLNKMDYYRDICEQAGRVCLYHYTMPAIAPLILDGGFRMSTQGQGDGGVYFSTLGPSSYEIGSDKYEDNIIIDCFGKERLEEYRSKHKLDVCLVYSIDAKIVEQAPGGRDNAVVVPKSYFEDLSLPHSDGSYFLRPDHILGAFLLDPAKPPSCDKTCLPRLKMEREKDLHTQQFILHPELASSTLNKGKPRKTSTAATGSAQAQKEATAAVELEMREFQNTSVEV